MSATKIAAAVLFLTLLLLSPSLSIVDPHDPEDPDRCRSCHTPEIHDRQTGDYDYYLLKDSIDEVCLICHKKRDCCVVGQEHLDMLIIGEHTHPSDLHRREASRQNLPDTLPLQDDRITCQTCHSHDRKEEQEYKLLRFVSVSQTKVDWTPLCADCHDEY